MVEMPRWKSRIRSYESPHGELTQTNAITAAASSTSPPTVSVRRALASVERSDQDSNPRKTGRSRGAAAMNNLRGRRREGTLPLTADQTSRHTARLLTRSLHPNGLSPVCPN